MCIFCVRMRRILLTLDAIDTLCLVYSNLCSKIYYLESVCYKQKISTCHSPNDYVVPNFEIPK